MDRDNESFEPQWLNMTALDPPKPLQELELRSQFETIQGDLYVSQFETIGLAKVLLLKREFHLTMRFEDIQPAKNQADDSAQ